MTTSRSRLPFWRERNFILYRDGDMAALTVEGAGEAMEMVNDDRRALSDHAALFARFRVVRGSGAERVP